MSKLLSGKVKKIPSTAVSADRYNFLELSEAEPDLGVPSVAGYVLSSDTTGNRSWVSASGQTASELLTSIKTVDGTGSGLDADLLDGLNSATTNTASSIVARDASGNFAAGTITAALSGNATTATTLATARNINGTSFNGSADITTANWGTARTLTIGATGKSVNGSANVSWTLDELQAEYRQPNNTIRGNLGDPTVREMALFHGQFNNKFRFIPATIQEESTDGTTWTTSTRATANQLADIMLGEGQTGGITAIPSGTVGTFGAYRLTWDVVGQTGYVFLNNLYFYNSANGNTVTALVEAFHNTNGWTTITGPHNFTNWPGHTNIPHSLIAYSANAAQYGKVRVTFTTTHNATTNSFDLYAIEWFGGFPAGRRNVETYDRNKNVTFPASISSPSQLISTVATGTAPLTITSTTRVANLNVATAGTADTLTTARTINGTSFNGSANITVTANTTNALTIGTGLSGTSFNGSGAVTIAIDSTVATLTGTQTLTNKTISGASNTLSNIGNASLTNSSVTIGTTAIALGASSTSLTGITSIGFASEGSDSSSISTTISSTSTFFDFNLTDDNNNDWWRWRFTPSGSTVYDAMTLKPSANGVANLTLAGSVTGTSLISNVVTGTAPLTVTSTTRVANLNVATAGTADTLTTARTINGTSFNGSANITITAANPNALTIGTGLSGTSYTGSAAVTIALANTAVTAGSYTAANITVDAQGRITAAANGTVTETDTLATVTGRGATTATALTLTNATQSTSTTTGALILSGGLAVSKNVYVGETLFAASKSFLIPHPTKEGKKLRYGSLEGPENGVYIRGRLKDNNTIELPEYWTKLVDEDSITVNLTPIGKHQNLYVESIENNKVIVSNSNLINKTINCFFVVYGERIDIDKLQVEI